MVATNPRQANIYDVARLAKVSHQTVSRVINNNSSIRPETKTRVLKAMEALDYRPNQAARALASSKTKMIGILASDTDFTGPASMVHEMERAAREQGYFVVSCGIDPTDNQSVREGIDHLQRLGIEGLAIVTPHANAVEYVRATVSGIPVVTLDSMYRMDELAVSVDNFAGGVTATQHLLDLGHKEIVHISGPKDWFESTTRAAGYTSTMLNANLVPRVIDGDWEISTGYRIGSEINFVEKGITAVFLANDRMALGFLHAMRQRGVSVPEQLSVIGFDDLEESQYAYPPLTTVRQDFRALGERAMQLLLLEIKGTAYKKLDRLVPELVVRSSTARLAAL
ncbi:LacI family DNA-binding transcriptional regulator [Aquiluna sp. KACHI24]|uniref:LacI family DNA-binding transcriptional regulator n=1 Tax=Aquiluna sp. KACHI24 TaxID=2968831 RepID=UPI002208A6DB|nr:LacI family DNA-binding transcriptional regulator [Aquiluna sp. KACHI24]BDQ00983.1 LacI family transcriptional regulator [Aquiluna sp. KACHI24]